MADWGLLVTSAISNNLHIVWNCMADWGLLVTSDISNNLYIVWQTGVSWLHLTSPTISTLYGRLGSLGYICHLQQSLHCMADWGLLVTSDISNNLHIVWQTGVSWLHLPSPTISTLYGRLGSLGYICHLQQSPHCMELYGRLGSLGYI